VTAAFPANTDLVVQAWLAQLPGFSAGMVGADLPQNADSNASIQSSGFVTEQSVGGTPEMYVPERQPVVQIDTWAPPLSTGKRPQWNVANALAERIVKACYNLSSFNTVLVLPTGYPTARVHQAHLLQEPHRVYGDKGYYARFRFDVQFYWIELPS
jgi:hypothetical protein